MSEKNSKKNIKKKVSIVIVHYKVKDELFVCLQSIYKLVKGITFEILVVDNDERKNIQKELHLRFPEVIYIPTQENLGNGAGNNAGALQAKGEYLFVLNPDTVFLNNAAKVLSDFLDKNKRYGIVAPLLYDEQKNVYPKQGTQILTRFRAVFSLSFLSKIFPNNPIAKKYWLTEWNKKSIKKVGAVPG